jgi:hypothetical protein
LILTPWMGRWICSKGLQSLVYFPPSFLPTLDFRVRSLLLCMSCNGVFSPWVDCFLCSLCVLRSQITLWSADPHLSFAFCDRLWREGSGLMRVREWGCWQILTSSCI